MNKYISIVLFAIIFLLGVSLFVFDKYKSEVSVSSPKDATYKINGRYVKLINGLAEEEVVPGSASKIITRYFGNEVKHDFDGDGREDVAFLLTEETGGSGIFYYVVVALNTADGYVGSEGLLLGDRIAPQTTEISQNPSHKDVIVVNYAVRKEGEPMTTSPSVGKSIWLKLDLETLQFGEVAQNFEGEADPSRMSLSMKKWIWISTTYNDGKVIKPKRTDVFTLTFNQDRKTFSATTDCNGVGGEYKLNQSEIVFDKMVSTLMYCEGSQEADFSKSLSQAQIYHFTGKGELVFDLKFDSGVMIFR